MAFEFFRRRQKLVIVIMVVLMVAFLVPTGLRGCFNREQDPVLGNYAGGEFKASMLRSALADIEILGAMGLAELRMGMPGYMEFSTLTSQRDAGLAYALLLDSARESGWQGSDAQVDQFFTDAGAPVGSEAYQQLLSSIRARYKFTEKDVRSAVSNWLAVFNHYQATSVDVPPSQAELEHLYVDLNAQMNLQAVKFEAEKFIAEAPEPTAEDVQKLFDQYRSQAPGIYRNAGDLGFGYRQADRVALAWLLVNYEPLTKAVEVPAEDIRKYYIDNQDQFVRPPTPATATTQATAPAEPTSTHLTLAEARARIIEILKPQVQEQRMESLAKELEAMLARQGAKDAEAFMAVYREMVQPADALLARPVGPLSLEPTTLEAALEKLAKAAKLRKIVFPLDEVGDVKISPTLKVNLELGQGGTLGEALASLAAQVKAPKLSYRTVKGFDNVLFTGGSDSEVQMLPVEAGSVGLSDIQKLRDHEVLSMAYTPARQPVLQLAFTAGPLAAQGETAAMNVGDSGPRSFVLRKGMMIWTLLDAKAAEVPQAMTDEIRQQVVNDWKLRQAMDIAREKARKLLEEAAKSDLNTAAKAAGYEPVMTGMFSRKQAFSPQAQLYQQYFMALQSGQDGNVYLRQMILASPMEYYWSQVPGIDLPQSSSNDVRKLYVEQLFKLAPAQKDPPYQDKPLAVITEPAALRGAVVVQRLDYTPAVTGEFAAKRDDLLSESRMVKEWQNRLIWFAFDNIARRTGFIARQAEAQ